MSKHLSAVRRIGARAVRHRLALPAALLVSALGIASVPAGSIASAATGNTSKSFAADVTATVPAPLVAGTQGTVDYAITNTSSQQSFGSAEVTFPGLSACSSSDPYGLCSASPPSGWTVSVVSANPATLLFEAETSAAAILPSNALDFSVSIETLPTAQAVTYTPTVVVKQANDFNGSGNEFQDGGSSTAFTVQPGGYSLQFVRFPKNILQSVVPYAYNYLCPPVEVQAYYTVGTTTIGVANASVSIVADTASPYGDPGLYYSSSVGGTPTQVTATGEAVQTTGADGIATFGSVSSTGSCGDGLAVANAAGTYALQASTPAPNVSPVDSPSFTVIPQNGACLSDGAGCTQNFTSTNPTISNDVSQTTVSLTPGTTPYTFLGQYGGLSLSCDVYLTGSTTDQSDFEIQTTDSSLGGTVTLTYTKALVQAVSNNGTPQLPVCVGADVNFPSFDSVSPGLSNQYEGLLYNCSDSTYQADIKHLKTYPLQICILSESKAGFNGGEQVVVSANNLSDPVWGV